MKAPEIDPKDFSPDAVLKVIQRAFEIELLETPGRGLPGASPGFTEEAVRHAARELTGTGEAAAAGIALQHLRIARDMRLRPEPDIEDLASAMTHLRGALQKDPRQTTPETLQSLRDVHNAVFCMEVSARHTLRLAGTAKAILEGLLPPQKEDSKP